MRVSAYDGSSDHLITFAGKVELAPPDDALICKKTRKGLEGPAPTCPIEAKLRTIL